MSTDEGSSAEGLRPQGPLPMYPEPRTRPSPFFKATLAAGVKAFSVYNHMLLPEFFLSADEEYRAVTEGVSIWDVGVERQVQIAGPDAEACTQYLVTRDVSKLEAGQARYVFVCNYRGGILNDPVLLKLSNEKFWLSLADRDILLWADAIAHERGFDVEVSEPDVSPLQIQGPKSANLMGDVFGPEVRDLKYYRFAELEHEGVPLVISRTGWSGEYGYEVFLRDGSQGQWLWDLLFKAGAPHGVTPGAPNNPRRIEGGILSYGSDMDDDVNPFELGFGRLVQFEGDFVGREALEKVRDDGVIRKLVGIRIPERMKSAGPYKMPVLVDGQRIGAISSHDWSPRFNQTLALAMVGIDHAEPGTSVTIDAPNGELAGTVAVLPFVESTK